MIGRVLAISRMGLLQLLRSRLYLSLLVAGVALIGAAFLLDRLSAGEVGRGFAGLGLAFSSLIVAILVGVTGITMVTREIETGQIHLVVGRPIRRAEFVVGRFLSLAALVLVSNLVLGTLLAIVYPLVGGTFPFRIAVASLFVSSEGLMLAALALFFGVGSSTTVSALFVTTTFILGRLSPILYSLVQSKRFGDLGPVVEAIYFVLPHFDRFDLSLWTVGGPAPDVGSILGSLAYGALYTAGLLGLACWRLEKRDLL